MYKFFLSPNMNLLNCFYQSKTDVISIIDQAFHPVKVVMSLSSKNLTPSPADEQMYLLHFVTYSLFMYYWCPELCKKIYLSTKITTFTLLLSNFSAMDISTTPNSKRHYLLSIKLYKFGLTFINSRSILRMPSASKGKSSKQLASTIRH